VIDTQPRDPAAATAQLRKATILLDSNRPREAAALASRVIASEPSDPRGWIMLARCYESLQDLPRALETANRAIGIDPSDPDPHLVASRVLRLQGNTREAVRAGQEAVHLAPMNAVTHATLATALASHGGPAALFGLCLPRDKRVAAEHARHAMALAPTSTTGHFAAGFVAAASGRPRQARAHYRRVLILNPQSAPAINNLAALDMKRGRLVRSGSGFARALVADPRLSLARRNVRGAVLTWLWRFHVLAWVIYVCFSGGTDNEPVVPFTLAWSSHATDASWLMGIFAVLVTASYLRMEPNVRAFFKQLIADSWSLKLVALADLATIVCFVLSTLGRGPTASNVNLLGFLAIVISVVGLARCRSRR
jgi:tetratricopeptide (TPR) repeat protein